LQENEWITLTYIRNSSDGLPSGDVKRLEIIPLTRRDFQMGFKEWIIPQEKYFFDLLSRQSDVVLKCGLALSDLVRDPRDIAAKSMAIEEIENEGDGIVHELARLLNRTFVTPIDHDDISKLASNMDDIVDFIDAGASRMRSYQIKEIPVSMIDLTETIVNQITEVNKAIHGLSNRNSRDTLLERCVEVNRLENVADDIVHTAVAGLFRLDDIKQIIKLKEIYELLEDASDSCEDVADIVKDVVIKNA